MPVKLTAIRLLSLQNAPHYYRFQFATWKQRKVINASILAYAAYVRDIFFGQEKPVEEAVETVQPVKPNLIQEADSLFAKKQYKESYELLNQVRDKVRAGTVLKQFLGVHGVLAGEGGDQRYGVLTWDPNQENVSPVGVANLAVLSLTLTLAYFK